MILLSKINFPPFYLLIFDFKMLNKVNSYLFSYKTKNIDVLLQNIFPFLIKLHWSNKTDHLCKKTDYSHLRHFTLV